MVAKPNARVRIAATMVAAAFVANAKEVLNVTRWEHVAARATVDSAVTRVTSGK